MGTREKRLLAMVVGLFFAFGAWAEEGLNGLEPRVHIEIGMLAAAEKRMATEWVTGEIAGFVQSHPGIVVSTLNIDEPKRWYVPMEKLPTLPRNVFSMSSMSGYEPIYLADRGVIVPIEAFLPDPEFRKEDFYEALWEPVTYGGKTWGVPWCSEPRVLICDWRLFEAEGIKEPPRTWEELYEAAGRLTKDTDGDGQTDQWGFRIADADEVDNLILTMVLQQGATLLTEDGIDANEPALREAVEYVRRFMASGYAKIYPHSPVPGERFAMQLEDVWSVQREAVGPPPEFEGREKEFRLIPLPTNGRDVQLNFGTLYLTIRRSTPEEEAASWQLVKWLTRRDVTLPRMWGGYPCRKDFVGRPDFKAACAKSFQGLELIYTLNDHLEDYGRNDLQGMWWGLQVLFEQHIREALKQGMPIEPALKKGQEEGNRVIERMHAPERRSYALYRREETP